MSKSRKTRAQRIKAQGRARTALKKASAFNVFEIGAGREPLALIRKAQRSIQRKKNRVFVGADKALNLSETIRLAGIKNLPKNITLAQKCAIGALLKAKPESQHVIFGSYLVNMLSRNTRSCFIPSLECEKAIFVAAEKALRPGGRIILIQDRDIENFMREAAYNLGLELHFIPLTDRQLQSSESWAIQMRSNREKRMEYLKESKIPMGDFKAGARSLKLGAVDECARPTAFILRKPRKGQKKMIISDRAKKIEPGMVELGDLIGRFLGF